ncbi:TorF family putative porin [Aurantiacibacter flavus]|uniref:TorF family putative porin n=1 Tax=Aurantiacibacter flavus TaxID=3145232 RepID=A0ABV0D0W3_9SPHN
MLTSVRSLLAATVLAGSVFAAAAPAAAQDIELSGNAAVVSEYRFRGVDLSGGDIAIQGGVDAAIGGFYVGTWGSSLDEDTVGFGHTELDIYAGYAGSAGVVSYDIGVLAYLYPNAGPGDTDYIEPYASVGVTAGPADVTLGIAYAPEQDSLNGEDNFYIYTDVGVGIPNTPVSLSGHLGYTDGYLTFTTDQKAWDWSIGADVALGSVASVGVAYVGAEGNPSTVDDMGTVTTADDFIYDFVDDAVVVTLSASF